MNEPKDPREMNAEELADLYEKQLFEKAGRKEDGYY